MRFMLIVKANADTEAGRMPSRELIEEMGRYNEELMKAGVLLAGDGLHPSSAGARVLFSGVTRTVVDGPFAETKELSAGFWRIQGGSRDEASEGVKRCPTPTGGEAAGEVRQVCEAEGCGGVFAPGARAAEARIREQLASKE
jgi:hypothetical protein